MLTKYKELKNKANSETRTFPSFEYFVRTFVSFERDGIDTPRSRVLLQGYDKHDG